MLRTAFVELQALGRFFGRKQPGTYAFLWLFGPPHVPLPNMLPETTGQRNHKAMILPQIPDVNLLSVEMNQDSLDTLSHIFCEGNPFTLFVEL